MQSHVYCLVFTLYRVHAFRFHVPLKIYCESTALVEVSEEKVYSEKLAIVDFFTRQFLFNIFCAFLKG
jgi:hypothetical protein